MSQERLGEAVGKTRQMIARYEDGAELSADMLGRIAVQLGISEVSVNGFRFQIRQQSSPDSSSVEQLELEFGKEHTYQGATIRITPTRLMITITATAPAPLKPAA
jgi:transcriptional regulator with XRE-family HTH domain